MRRHVAATSPGLIVFRMEFVSVVKHVGSISTSLSTASEPKPHYPEKTGGEKNTRVITFKVLFITLQFDYSISTSIKSLTTTALRATFFDFFF